ncbi:NAD-dependent epimerase/dehydratase family protein [Neobacillus sp.]|uniref:NAD-dependent epimerase/dehydratase family protein n=1 Tax=Neobacillus sp. TaxID=2675273 RepID=UPI00289898D2|nr:NAD-dependent epimerase/dehydratase family protein [Neobacillus sp.]
MEKKILITGVAGFLGSQLAKSLIMDGHLVVGLDNLSSGKIINIKSLPKNRFIFKEVDLCSRKILADPDIKNVDEIYHLASPAAPKFYQAAPFETINVNTIGTRNMLELAKIHGAKMVYTSTSEAYGEPEIHPQPETYRGNVNTWGPRACYDESKRLGEVLCYLYFTHYQTPVKVARIFNTYSAGLTNDDGRVISNFVTQALKGEDITVYGDGSQTRSFCYVTDTISGLKLLMEKEEATGEIINIGNPVEFTILKLAHFVKALTGSDSKIIFRPLPENDPKVRRPVIEKAKRLLGWEPTVSLREGLDKTITEYRTKLGMEGS